MALPRTILVPVALLGMVGCSNWPTWSLKGQGVRVLDPDSPADDVVDVDWVDIEENEADGDNDQPTTTPQRLTLGELDAVVVSGSLVGAGWLNTLDPEQLSGGDCGDSSGTRTPPTEEGGDYVFDVDTLIISFGVTEPATLCMGVQMAASGGVDADKYGYDVVLHEVDDCGVPVALADNTLPGFGLGYENPKPWSYGIEPGVTYALVLGAYHPIVPEIVGDYQVSMAVLPGTSATLCPAPPFSEEG